MNSFISKQILTSQTIGERLAKAREGASLSQEDVSLKIGIKERYISAIEFGLYSELPGEIYALEFIKKYAAFLRMDPKSAACAYKKERGIQKNSNYKLSAKGESYKLAHRARWAANTLVLTGVAVFIVYAFVLGRNIFSPPSILIIPEDEYIKISSSQITLQGKVLHAKEVCINTDPIILSKDGTFIESFNLPKGVNLLKITARSRFGKVSEVYRVVYVEEAIDQTLVLQQNDK
ncbi:helix-turn-helix domain-containing protein [Patescibacteria group bacterium]|nr:helix-turn-helix domain-containing protein [Patescibacteria group bacterium]